MNRKLLSICLFLLAGCIPVVDETGLGELPADTIFVGDNIITMQEDGGPVDAVAVRGEDIIAVGRAERVLRYRGERTRVIELGDHALLPGFVDSHGHFSAVARLSEFVNLSSPPVGSASDIGDIVALLQERIAAGGIAESDWVIGYGYDDSLLAERRHPTRLDLDRISATHPVLLIHVSGHLAATNSAALNALGIDAESPDPDGGVIRRQEGSRIPNGVLEETAASRVIFAQLRKLGGSRLVELSRKAANQYASYGVTTVQDGAITPGDLAVLKAAAVDDPYIVDIGTYTYVNALTDEAYTGFVVDDNYVGGIRQVGVKFSLDGSPQGRTAWVSKPYAEGPPGADADYVAYPTMEREFYLTRVADLLQRGIPVLVHANGDAAIDMMIEGISSAVADADVVDHRAVIIHAQLMREDQVSKAAALGIVSSFFSAHTFFWGDWHRRSFGDLRAANISPTRWAVEHHADFTLHNDAPVVPPDMMRLLWATVNRKTRSGHILGPQQKLTVYEALRALTLGGAYQYFEEDRKGSIHPGKQADLVILNANPLQVEPDELKALYVVETFSRGRSVYKKRSVRQHD